MQIDFTIQFLDREQSEYKMAAGAQSTVMEALGGAHMNKERKC